MKRRAETIRTFVHAGVVLLSLIAVHPVWAQDMRGGIAPQEILPRELKGLEIKDTFLSTALPEVGVIHGLEGRVVVIHQGTGEAYYGSEGDTLYEKDTLTTLADSRCRIRFHNEDIVTIAPETRFGVETHEYRKEEGKTRSIFSLLKGKAMFYALRLFRYRENKVTLNTPTAVVGVRGTKFGAEVAWIEEKKHSGAGLKVADLGGKLGAYLAQTGSETGEGRSFTNCFSEDGVLDVNGKIVRPGEMYRGETGLVIPTPPEYVSSFEAQTEVRKQERGPGKAVGPEGKGEPRGEKRDKKGDKTQKSQTRTPSPGMLGRVPGPEMFSPPWEQLVNIESQQEGKKAEQEWVIDPFPEGKVAGRGSFIAAMILQGNKDGKAFNNDGRDPMYFSIRANPLNAPDDLQKHVAFENAHPDDAQFRMEAQETDAAMNMEVRYFTLNHASNKAMPTPHVFQYTHVGSYQDPKGSSYLEWGYWMDTSPLSTGLVGKDAPAAPPNNLFDVAKGMIWNVEGDLTHPDYIDHLQSKDAVFNYSGSAVGVFASSAASQVHILGGSFDCRVHFGSRQVSNFTIDTSESGNYRVNLVGGSGSLDGNGAFQISGSSFGPGSTINGHSIIAGETGANGALYGPKAEGAGGIWHANGGSSSQYWATGEFHGKRSESWGIPGLPTGAFPCAIARG